MDVSIIIVNYNTSELLDNCISTIYKYTSGITFEIIVVDNSSTDNSCKFISEKYSNIILIESEKNLGFGKANNLGASFAKGKYLFLLNTDMLLVDNSIKYLFEFMEKQEEKIAVCGGNLFNKDMLPNFSYSLYYPSLWTIFCYRAHLLFFLNNEYFNHQNIDKKVSIIIGADIFVRKNVFEEVNGFDPDYFMYVEEGDLQLRISKKGYSIKSFPLARFIHLQGASSNTLFKIKEEIKSYKIYFKKHFPRKYYLYLVIELLNCFFKYFYSLLKGDKNLINIYEKVLIFLIFKR